MADTDFEHARRSAFRTFEVTFRDGSAALHINAHFHDGGSGPAGLLNFVTVAPNGHQIISDSLPIDVIRQVHELEIVGVHQARSAMSRALARMHPGTTNDSIDSPSLEDLRLPTKKVM